MQIIETEIPDLKIIEPKVFKDDRGYFFESYNKTKFDAIFGETIFIQDNESFSKRGTLRGMHYQLPPFAQAKLVRVVQGEVLDVALDIRRKSPTFGKSVKVNLSAENKRQFFIPHGFAHAFIVLSETAIFQYKVDNIYSREHEGGVFFADPELNIDWILTQEEILLSEKDKVLPLLKNAATFE